MPATTAAVRWLALLSHLAIASSARLRHAVPKNNAEFRLKLDNFDNIQYCAAFSFGEQTLPVIYDTGSFEILVLSELCTSCSRAHDKYDSTKSTSFITAEGVVAEHVFGSGPVLSEKGFESVHLGGMGSPYHVDRMPFWQVVSHEIPVWNENAHFSGIVGLGHPSRIPEAFGAEGELEQDETLLSALGVGNFALCLERGAPDAPGWLSMGPSVDALARSSAFSSLEVVGKVHWGVRMTDFHIPNVPAANPCVPSCGAIVDSGTSLIAVPPSAVSMVNALSMMVKRDCSNLRSLPVLRMQLDGKMIELPPRAYVLKVKRKVYRNGTMWRMYPNGRNYEVVDQCAASFMAIDKESQFGPIWILGMPFLRYYHTVFDRTSKRIHVARSRPTCSAGAAELPGLFNATGLEGVSGRADSGAGAFTAEDYQPTLADLNGVRAPAWALEEGVPHIDL